MSRLSSRRLSERVDLSVPRGASPRMGARYDADAFGRMSEAIARFLGTGRFLVGQTVLVIGWIVLNTIGLVNHWDPYPFILLNLAFSTQAAYAAPLILLAQNRQDDRDRANIERDREVAAGPRPTPSSSQQGPIRSPRLTTSYRAAAIRASAQKLSRRPAEPFSSPIS